ncbi:TonB-dependent receptor [Thalassomonas viridans]|uniref:TonB-dependent receptor n=1 Tax=Thalassomonas viridans TaxID=137584 RepID=A0AAF0CAP3_9GAMM|nr:TonB-dependent receptor [Thalassomonas viridans]WDE06540.1 TonB-dependent receptor [Thalassomonas viridans]
MKKTLLALSVTSALTSSLAFAAPEAGETQIDETLVVTANRTLENKFDVLAAVDVFDRDAIEEIQPLSVGDLLNRLAGINVVNQGTKANNSSVFVRGANSDHVLILINGVRVGSATLGIKSLASLSLPLIERIEVVRGPRAAQWGSDAIGGVVQIFTRDFASGEGQIGSLYGSDNTWQAYGAIGFGNSEHNYTLSASKESSDGYDVNRANPNNPWEVEQPDEDGYELESVAIRGTSRFTNTYQLEFSSQLEQGDVEFDSSQGDESEFKNHHILLRNHFQLENSNLQLSYANSRDRDITSGNNTTPGLLETRRDQLSGLIQIPLGEASELVAGADWYKEDINSSASSQYAKDKRKTRAFYLTGRHQLDRLKLEASLRRDKVERINSETTYQLGAGYQVNDNLLVAVTHSTAFKAPTFNDLYHPFGGNEDLTSETADNTELLVRYQEDGYSAEVSLYHTDYDDLIEWAPIDPNDPFSVWSPANIDQADIKGIEATLSADLFGTSNSLTLSHTDAENDKTGLQLARRPYFSANYSIHYQGNNWDAAVDINHQGSRYNDASHNQHLGSYTLVNLVINYQLTEQFKLSAKVDNLTDKSYETSLFYPGAERGYSLNLDYRF